MDIDTNWNYACKILKEAFTKPHIFTFIDRMAMETPYTEKEIEIFMDFNPDLNEDNIKNILHYCMNSGGLLKPLELTPLQIELILNKTAKS